MTHADLVQEHRFHIVVTCSNRKTEQVPDELRLGNLPRSNPGQRFATWINRIGDYPVAQVPAINLYAGEHWQIARTLPDLVSQPATLWVCSAGYGLIPANAAIKPYAATFAPGESDSVARSPDGVRDWWERLTNWTGPGTGQPRSLADMARRDPRAVIVAVLSAPYLRACVDDLNRAAGYLADSDQLSVIGPDGRCPDAANLLVPVTARLRSIVGGTLTALNVRAAGHVLRTATANGGALSRQGLKELMKDAIATAPPDPSRRPPGKKLTDEEVRDFIRREITGGAMGATAALGHLRNSGRSCEQSRFHRLFAAVKMEVER